MDSFIIWLFGWPEHPGPHDWRHPETVYLAIFLLICLGGATERWWKPVWLRIWGLLVKHFIGIVALVAPAPYRWLKRRRDQRMAREAAEARRIHEEWDRVMDGTEPGTEWLRQSPERVSDDREYSALKEAAFKDEVTGLYNRRFFSIRLAEEVARCQSADLPVSVVLLNLDGVGSVVDESRRKAGEEVLRSVAEVLLRHTRGINVISRYDGDLFAVLLVETSQAGARLYVDRIRYVWSSVEVSHGHPITPRFGIASLPDDAVATPEDLFRLADEALRAARRAAGQG